MIDRELLRKAYPSGCLCTWGVSTVGGFACVGYIPEGSAAGWHFFKLEEGGLRLRSCIVKKDDTSRRVRGIVGGTGVSDDDLLPNLTDPATWACCLWEMGVLLDLVPPTLSPKEIVTGHVWSSAVRGWQIEVFTDSGHGFVHVFSDIETDDPTAAFLIACARLRAPIVCLDERGEEILPPPTTPAEDAALRARAEAIVPEWAGMDDFGGTDEESHFCSQTRIHIEKD
jgi:hypothetical protein